MIEWPGATDEMKAGLRRVMKDYYDKTYGMKCPKCQVEMEESKRRWKKVYPQSDSPLAMPRTEEEIVTVKKCPKCGYAEADK